MANNQAILITNPGSSSRKYALYRQGKPIVNAHFEFEDGKIVCTLKNTQGKKKIDTTLTNLTAAPSVIDDILLAEQYMQPGEDFGAVVARVAAPGKYFAADHRVDAEFLEKLTEAKARAPLHVPVVAGEIEQFTQTYPKVSVMAISDSAIYANRPEETSYYAIDHQLAEQFEIRRFGYHGLSVGFIINYLKTQQILPEKLVVCHIGSGVSVSAVLNGEAIDNSMGYSPLEGAVMATRSGNLDVAAGLAIKRALKLSSDQELELYLNKEAGLKGLAKTDDLREVIAKKEQGERQADRAYRIYIHRLQSLIGQMSATLGGIDAIVFTATAGERNSQLRADIMEKLEFLGFKLDTERNQNPADQIAVNISSTEKPVWVIKTDETAEMLRRAELLLK